MSPCVCKSHRGGQSSSHSRDRRQRELSPLLARNSGKTEDQFGTSGRTVVVLVRVVWLVLFTVRNFFVLAADQDHILSLASVYFLSLLRGRAEGTDKFERKLPDHSTHLPTVLH